MAFKRVLIVTLVLLLASLACSLPGSASSQSDLAGTITAQAALLQVPTETAGPPAASANANVEVSVTSDTNCRTGPSQAFALVLTARPGQKFKVVGRNTPTDYWIIENPAGGTCWLWGRYAVITGDPSTLPEYPAAGEPAADATKTPKSTKTPEATVKAGPTVSSNSPIAPSDLAWGRTCTAFMDGSIPKWREDITLTWSDNSNDETGFQLWTGPSSNNASLWATVPANTESINDTRTYNQGTGGPLFDNYQVVAFNANGGTFGGAVDVPRCP